MLKISADLHHIQGFTGFFFLFLYCFQHFKAPAFDYTASL